MKPIQTLLCTLALVSVIVYLFKNCFSGAGSDLGASSVAFGWLCAAGSCGTIAVLVRALRSPHIAVNKSIFPLLMFLVYFVIKMVIDITDPVEFKSYTIGTSGGIIFGYLLGMVSGLCAQGILELNLNRNLTIFRVSLGVFLLGCLFVALLIAGYRQIMANLHSVYLVISDVSGYQRSGNFLSMLFLLISIVVVTLSFINKKSGKVKNKLLTIGTFLVYIAVVPLVMYVGQLLGSNSVVLFVILISINSVTFIFIVLREQRGTSEPVSLIKIATVGGVAISALIILVLCSIYYFNINVENLRLLNFGKGGAVPSSISSRLVILENDYIKQLSYDPVFGNMAVDSLTTGRGSYAHSLPLSLLTHLGFVGFTLFALFVWLRIRELRRADSWCGVVVGNVTQQRNYQLFICLSLIAVMLMASLTTFFVWMPLWFALGMLAPPLIISSRNAESFQIAVRISQSVRDQSIL